MKIPCCKKLLHSYQQWGNNDVEDYDQLILESRDDPELQDEECTVSVKEYA